MSNQDRAHNVGEAADYERIKGRGAIVGRRGVYVNFSCYPHILTVQLIHRTKGSGDLQVNFKRKQ